MVPQIDGLPHGTQARFLALRQHYLVGLSERWAEISGATDAQVCLAALHRLAGSAASFGFERIGARARDAEVLVGSDGVAELKLALALLEAEIGQALTGPPTE